MTVPKLLVVLACLTSTVTSSFTAVQLRDAAPFPYRDEEDLPPIAQLIADALNGTTRLDIPHRCQHPRGRAIDFVVCFNSRAVSRAKELGVAVLTNVIGIVRQVSHYKENLQALAHALIQMLNTTHLRYSSQFQLPCLWLITKGGILKKDEVWSALKDGGVTGRTLRLAFVSLPNRGREPHSMLFYLAYNSDLKNYESHPGIFPLFTNSSCPHGSYRWAASMNSNLVVSTHRMMQHSPEVYEAAFYRTGKGVLSPDNDLVRAKAGGSHYVGHELLVTKPILAHAFERAWNLIFNCTDTSVQSSCRCQKEDPICTPNTCQCLDATGHTVGSLASDNIPNYPWV
ncbi:hypothetical protein QJQ45_000453 [Haematococcus lacustris]|nr:hypothetical protein QJQ45_000453 [Haematococcus lacustris]